MNPTSESKKWEKEFDRFYPDWGADIIAKATTATEISMGERMQDTRNKLKSFIHQTLLQQKQEIREKVKSVLTYGNAQPYKTRNEDYSDGYVDGYQSAIKVANKLLSNPEEKK